MLWWKVHEPDAPELVPDPATQRLFDQGTRVGELARTYVPGGRLVDLPHDRYDERLAVTQAALDADERVLYEASFSADRTYVAVDILERQEKPGQKRIHLTEVKSSTKVKPEHVVDVALQVHVLERAGLEVESAEVMHLNRGCEYPDLSDLFVRTDVTREVRSFLPEVPELVAEQLAMLEGPLPAAAIGAHCSAPYPCPFRERCWADVPEHHVTTMHHAGRKAWDWLRQGFHTVQDLPETTKLTPVARRQRRAVIEGRRIVGSGLAKALAQFARPLAFLDFETVMPAIPRFEGCHPFDQIPVQFSCHREKRGGGYEHEGWLADGPHDPRPEIAERVVTACAGMATILAYNASFERKRLEELAQAPGVSPVTAARLDAIRERVEDLLPIVRENVYDPAFGGSFSLKSVVPALVPHVTYDDLEIADGETAMAALEKLLFPADDDGAAGQSAEERARLRAALEAYCERDTWATVQLFAALQTLEGPSPARVLRLTV
jgi:hypothetical protein